MEVRREEDLECWQTAKDLVSLVYSLSGQGRSDDEFGILEKMQRTVLYLYIHIEEAFERDHERSVVKHLSGFFGAVHELQAITNTALDFECISMDDYNTMTRMISSLQYLVAGFRTEYSDIY